MVQKSNVYFIKGPKIFFWNFLNSIDMFNFCTGLCVICNLLCCITPLSYWIWKNFWIVQKTLNYSKLANNPTRCIPAYAAKHFELSNSFLIASFDMLIPIFVAKTTQNQSVFHTKIPKSTFGFFCKDQCC